jgi:hypothetical protein
LNIGIFEAHHFVVLSSGLVVVKGAREEGAVILELVLRPAASTCHRHQGGLADKPAIDSTEPELGACVRWAGMDAKASIQRRWMRPAVLRTKGVDCVAAEEHKAGPKLVRELGW